MNVHQINEISGTRSHLECRESMGYARQAMHDAARLADVPISTVSALINGAPKSATSAQIASAMRAAGYTPTPPWMRPTGRSWFAHSIASVIGRRSC